MGFLTAWKASSLYERMLKAHGINPRSFPADVSGRICSYAMQDHERLVQQFPDLGGPMGVEAAMHNAARLVALCVLGATNFKNVGGDGVDVRTINQAAEDWQEYGSESSLQTMIIKTLRDSGFLNDEFCKIFDSMT